MISFVGDDLNMVVLPDGDFVHGQCVVVDTSEWSLEQFKQFDDCPAHLRQKLAVMFHSIIEAEKMSVVEITFDHG
jgi:inorganic pyrophosphatase